MKSNPNINEAWVQSQIYQDPSLLTLGNLEVIDKDDNTKQGLIPAIEEFIKNNPHWTIYEHYKNNNGLMILKRN